MKHFLDIHTTAATELRTMMTSAHAMKLARNGRPKGAPDDDQPLKGHMVALIFEKPSTRTRVSFDVGVRQMGGADDGAVRQAKCSLAMAKQLPTQRACFQPLCRSDHDPHL